MRREVCYSPRMQGRIDRDLLTQIGGRVEEDVVFAVGGDGYRGLSLWSNAATTGAGAQTTLTIAIPLWKTAAGSRSQNQYAQRQAAPQVPRPTPTASFSEPED